MKLKAKIVIFTIILLLGWGITSSVYSAGRITMEVTVGFDGIFRLEKWTPIQIILNNEGEDIIGEITAEVTEGIQYKDNLLVSSYSQLVILPSRSRKRYVLYVPLNQFNHPLRIKLTSAGRILLNGQINLRSLQTDLDIVLVLSEEEAGLNFLSFFFPQLRITYSKVGQLPDKWKGYEGLKAIIIGDVSLRNLTTAQEVALERWVYQGGTLVVTGSADLSRFGKTSPGDLLPVTIIGTEILSHLNSLEENYDQKLNIDSDFVVYNSKLREGRIILKEGDIPILAEVKRGWGRVAFLALDYEHSPLKGWAGEPAIWKDILGIKTKIYLETKLKEVNRGEDMLRIQGLDFPPYDMIGLFLLIYVSLFSLTYFYISRRAKHKLGLLLSTLPAIVILFSLMGYYFLAYGVAEKNIVVTELSTLDIPPGHKSAQVSTDLGLFSPQEDSYGLYFPSNDVFISLPGYGKGSQRKINVLEEETPRIRDINMDSYSNRLFKIEHYVQFPTEVWISDKETTAVISNNTIYDWKECLLIIEDSVYSIGNIASMGERNIDLISSQLPSHKSDVLSAIRKWYNDSTENISLKELKLLLIKDNLAGRNKDEGALLIGWMEDPLADIIINYSSTEESINTFKHKALALLKISIE